MYLCRTKRIKNNRLTAQVNYTYSCFLVTLTMYEGSDKKTGFHFHSHSIMWIENPISEEEKEALRKELSRLWVRCCFGVALQASPSHGCVVEFPHTKNGDVADVKPLAQYLAKKISYELTSDIYKDGRLSRRISIWELLRIAAETNDPRLWARWGEYMKGIKGVNFLRLTPGLRAFCGMEEKTDAELLEGATEELIYTFSEDDWALVVAQGAQRKLLYIIDAAVKEGKAINAAIEEALQCARLGCDIISSEALHERFL